MSENKKINFNDSIHALIKKDLFRRTVFVNDKDFHDICDKILLKL